MEVGRCGFRQLVRSINGRKERAEVVVEGLSDEELVRIDAVAAAWNLTREAMVAKLALVGLAQRDPEGVPPPPSAEGSVPG